MYICIKPGFGWCYFKFSFRYCRISDFLLHMIMIYATSTMYFDFNMSGSHFRALLHLCQYLLHFSASWSLVVHFYLKSNNQVASLPPFFSIWKLFFHLSRLPMRTSGICPHDRLAHMIILLGADIEIN